MDLILSTALTSITYTIYLFKKKNYEDIKKIKPFPTKTTFTSSSPNKETIEAAEAALEKEVTYYLEGLVSPIKPTEIISCANPKKKAVLLKVKFSFTIIIIIIIIVKVIIIFNAIKM